jgi:hypothetical protein
VDATLCANFSAGVWYIKVFLAEIRGPLSASAITLAVAERQELVDFRSSGVWMVTATADIPQKPYLTVL